MFSVDLNFVFLCYLLFYISFIYLVVFIEQCGKGLYHVRLKLMDNIIFPFNKLKTICKPAVAHFIAKPAARHFNVMDGNVSLVKQ